MQNILFVSHCILNTAAKVVLYDEAEIKAEEALRRRFVGRALELGVQMVQLPCPEFTLVRRAALGTCERPVRQPLFPRALPHPSGAVCTSDAGIPAPPWAFSYPRRGGGGRQPKLRCGLYLMRQLVRQLCEAAGLEKTLAGCTLRRKHGILMDVLCTMLKEAGLDKHIPVTALFAPEEEKCMGLLSGL